MKKFYPFLAMLATPFILILLSNSSGSPGGKSGSPGDGGNTCTQCHGGTATTMTGWITTNVPASGYVPGQTYSITATATHSGAGLIGFELTVETDNGTKIGTLQITEPTRTKLTNLNKAVTHTSGGTTPSGNSNSWTMNWIAPATAQGTIGIYAAFNAANGNGNTSGDVIYKSSTFISPFIPPPALVSIQPDEAEQGESFQATITGSNTQFTGNPSVSLSFSGNPLEVISATGVTILSATVLQVQFSIPGDASSGLWDVNVNALTLENGFTVNEAVPAILFMEPNFAHQGDSFNAAISGENTTWTGTPSVYLSYGVNPAETIVATNVTVVNSTGITADFAIPADASIGNYSIHVDELVKSDGFTVLQALAPALTGITPDNAGQGEMILTQITAENTQFTGGFPVVSLTLHTNPSEQISAENVMVLNNTLLEVSFQIPFDATPGLWDLNVDQLLLENAFTVIDVEPYLVSIFPDSALQSETVLTLITAADSRFTLSAPSVMLSFSGNPSEVIEATAVTVISDETAEVVFDIPSGATVGFWDLHVDDMLLEDAFEVVLLSGIAFAGTEQDPKVYPNPASGRFFIENAGRSQISLVNARGELLIRRENPSVKEEVEISGLSAGLYFVIITSEQGTQVQKLLVR